MATAPNFPRIVIDHARYWRGNPHVWSTNYFFGGDSWASGEAATVAAALVTMESNILLAGPSHAAGFIETRAYNAVTGPPAYTHLIGSLADNTTWQNYAGTAWASLTTQLYDANAEPCFYLDTPLAGLSSTGKPVKSTKYMHAVPNMYGLGATEGQLTSTIITAIESYTGILFTGVGPSSRRMISNGGRFASGPPTVRPFIGNHQMPQGRRKKKTAGSSLDSLLTDAAKLRAALGIVGDIE